jgi:hypothetical protein
LYVASIASGYFKSRLYIAYEMRVVSKRGREQYPRGRHVPRVGAGDAGAVERCSSGAGPSMDARKRTAVVSVRTSGR